MAENNLNSCLMLGMNLDTPVSLGCLFEDADLKDTGIEFDSHITLLYAQGKTLPKEEMIPGIENILGEDTAKFYNICKSGTEYRVLDLFDLDYFENDSDYIILRLKESSESYNLLKLINKGLRVKYGVKSDYDSYTPHLSLAELQPGTAKKYMNSEQLRLVLEDSIVSFEDVFISYGEDNEVDRLQYFLTTYHNLPRFFRIKRLKNYEIR